MSRRQKILVGEAQLIEGINLTQERVADLKNYNSMKSCPKTARKY